ncbi:vesicle coat component [Mortierella sp. GBA30]|nr:vesicle coat component [Mortierella sp. GBA30]
MSQQQVPVEDGPIPFFGGGPPHPAGNRAAPPPQRPLQHQQQQQQQQQRQQPFQPQPQRHPQQHPQQMPPQMQGHQSQNQPLHRPSRQMNQSPFAPAADLFSSPPTSNLLFNQAPPQGYQPQTGFEGTQGPTQHQNQSLGQIAPPRFPPQQSPVLQRSQQQQQQPPAPAQQPPPSAKQQQQAPPAIRPPVQQQQQQPVPNQFQRNPQQQPPQHQQQYSQQQTQLPVQESAPVPAPVSAPSQEQPFAPASDLFGNSTSQGVSSWAIPSTTSQPPVSAPAAPPVNTLLPHKQQQQYPPQQPTPENPFSAAPPPAPVPGIGRPPLPQAPLQKQPSMTQVPQVQQTALAPPPQRQPSLPSPQQLHQPPAVQQQQHQLAPSRQGSISSQGPPQGPPRQSPVVPGPHGPPPTQHGFDRSVGQLPPVPRGSIGTPRQGPLTGSVSSSSMYQGTSPYANHVPPKTPLLTAIQTPLMLPAQTPQAYQSSRTPYMGPIRNQFGSSSQLLLEPCPYSECGGENKPHAKFCSECGRSISAASRSATPSLGHYAEFPASAAPPMPNLERMNSYQQQQQFDQEQPQSDTYPGYAQDEQSNSHSNSSSNTNSQIMVMTSSRYNEAGYYDQSQQYYDPTAGQWVDTSVQQEQAVPEPEPEPEEEGIDDPLNRIHGCPLVAFGFGGKIVTSFPRTVQRFDSATSNMVTKTYPGDLQLEHIKNILPVDSAVSSYPGPLLMDSSVQMKNKRKDVLKLIDDKINEYEHEPESGRDAHHVLIWRLFKVMFEQEGALVGGAKVDEAVRSVLLSIPLTVYPGQPSQEPISPLKSAASMDVLQDLLRSGDRAGAVRYAMSSNLWAHALVISSCVNKELWKEAVNGFVNQELTSGGGDIQANGREALRVLYALFSGQTQSAVTELVPLNLRSPIDGCQDDAQLPDGQFVTGASLSLMKPVEEPKVSSASLGQWRDTLVMILSNRTSGDQTAISSLGDLLMKEGWVEAAHICYLLSPQNSVHSGPDAQSSRLVLIGADANPHAVFPFYKNVEAFQKTEIYEFACALRSAGATGGLPFLQAYKLGYVWTLVEVGMFSEAGRYLESIEAIVKTQTKGSPYYNAVFLERLKDITERLTGSSQLAVAGESWFAKKVPKPTIGGIFDALDNKISKFIAGDNDQPKPVVAEPSINPSESGPFANAPALPDLSNVPARTASRSSNGVRQGPPAANISRRSSGLGRPALDIPKADAYGHVHQPTVPHSEAIQQDVPAADANYGGYDQSTQYNAESYVQGDYNNNNGGYEYESQGYTYDSNQTYGETYVAEGGSTYQQNLGQDELQLQQPEATGLEYAQQVYNGGESAQMQAGYDGQYNAQYDAGQYVEQQQPDYEGTPGETVAALAIQPDVAPASVDSAQYSTQAVLGSEKPSTDAQHDAAITTATATVETMPAGEYDASYGQYTEAAENTYADATYNGEYQQGEYQQGEYQQGEYQQGEYHQDAYLHSEYQQDAYQQGEYQQDEYQNEQYQHEYQQDVPAYGEQQYTEQQQYDQSSYPDHSPVPNVEGGDQGLGAEYTDASYQYQGYEQQQPAMDDSLHQANAATEPATDVPQQPQDVIQDEPTYEQQIQTEVPAATTAPSGPVAEASAGAVNVQQDTYLQEEYQQGEYQHADYQQGEYQQSELQQGEYQQGEYQQGEYQQGEYQQEEYQHGEYQQGEYQQGEYQQGEYQQGEYQQGEYQQEDYQHTDYQQGDFQQSEYQQGEHVQEGYQQESHLQSEYHQEADYQQGEYQQEDYQQGEYPHDGYHQGGQQQGLEVEQASTEPGVLPVSDYQDQAEYNASGVYQGHPNGAEYSTEGEQQQDFSSNNNAWWGNGDGVYSDPNATEQQVPAVDGQTAAADTLQDNYEEGEFISFGAVPTIPTFGQPAVSVNNNNQQNVIDDDDDLGMGNNALKKKAVVTDDDADAANSTTAADSSQDPNAATAMDDGSDESKAGWWPKIALFGGDKRELTPKPVKANLGEESSFYFDTEQKRWVNKKGGSESSTVATALPPPPTSSTSTPAPTTGTGAGSSPVNRGPPSSGGPTPPAGAPPGPRPGAGPTARRGARSRYVDVLNTN